MLQVFGLTLSTAPDAVAPDVAATLMQRMAFTAQSLRGETPAALAGSVRADARRYLAARRSGELPLPHAAARRCDQAAQALLRLTLDAPATRPGADLLVA